MVAAVRVHVVTKSLASGVSTTAGLVSWWVKERVRRLLPAGENTPMLKLVHSRSNNTDPTTDSGQEAAKPSAVILGEGAPGGWIVVVADVAWKQAGDDVRTARGELRHG